MSPDPNGTEFNSGVIGDLGLTFKFANPLIALLQCFPFHHLQVDLRATWAQ